MALTDCAPLVMAGELGLFEKHGVTVELSREIGWATIRENAATLAQPALVPSAA